MSFLVGLGLDVPLQYGFCGHDVPMVIPFAVWTVELAEVRALFRSEGTQLFQRGRIGVITIYQALELVATYQRNKIAQE